MKAHHTLLLLALVAPLALLARTPGADGIDKGSAIPAGPTADQATTAKLVFGLLSDSRYAYRPQALDDALSQDIFKRYLEALDSGEQYFTAADIEKFGPYKTELDDAIRSGELAPAYDIFGVYKQRVGERVAYARALLKQDFDFTGDQRARNARLTAATR